MNYTYNINCWTAGGVSGGGWGSSCVTSNTTYYIGGGPWTISYSYNTNCFPAGTIYPTTIPVWEAEVDGEIEFEE